VCVAAGITHRGVGVCTSVGRLDTLSCATVLTYDPSNCLPFHSHSDACSTYSNCFVPLHKCSNMCATYNCLDKSASVRRHTAIPPESNAIKGECGLSIQSPISSLTSTLCTRRAGKYPPHLNPAHQSCADPAVHACLVCLRPSTVLGQWRDALHAVPVAHLCVQLAHNGCSCGPAAGRTDGCSVQPEPNLARKCGNPCGPAAGCARGVKDAVPGAGHDQACRQLLPEPH
jgi:hypothetical protein